MSPKDFQRAIEEPVQSGREADQPRSVVISSLVAIRSAGGHGFFAGGACPPLAHRQKLTLAAGADVENAGAKWSEQPLVPRTGKEINGEFTNIDRQMPGRLCRVDQKRNPLFLRDTANVLDGLNGAGDVRSVREGDQPGVAAKTRWQGLACRLLTLVEADGGLVR